MRFLQFVSKVSKRLGIIGRMYDFMRVLPVTPPRKFSFVNYSDALNLCHSIYPDNGKSCICSSRPIRLSPEYDVEIIIPVYNVEQYVAECVESILSQKTRFSYHLTIINDGSPDGSREILARFEGDKRVTITDQENRGFSGARNRGLELARGRYITFVDSDDRLPENAIETLMDTAVSGDYDIVCGGYLRFYGTTKNQPKLPSDGKLFGFPWGKVYKAEIWDGLKFPENYWFEDTISAFITTDKAKRKKCVQDVIYEWRINRKSISHSLKGRPKVLDTIYVTISLLDDRQRLGLPIDENFYDTLLHQFIVNANRVFALGNPKADYANFVISKALLEKHYGGKNFHSEKYKEIEAALKGDNYKQFLLAVMLLQ